MAFSNTGPASAAGVKCSSPRPFAGGPPSAFSVSLGMMIFLMPMRCAASAFSFKPPMGSTLPRRVISPVMATSLRTGLRVKAERMAVAIVMPALGPSFGVAPSGTWMWMSVSAKASGGMP